MNDNDDRCEDRMDRLRSVQQLDSERRNALLLFLVLGYFLYKIFQMIASKHRIPQQQQMAPDIRSVAATLRWDEKGLCAACSSFSESLQPFVCSLLCLCSTSPLDLALQISSQEHDMSDAVMRRKDL